MALNIAFIANSRSCSGENSPVLRISVNLSVVSKVNILAYRLNTSSCHVWLSQMKICHILWIDAPQTRSSGVWSRKTKVAVVRELWLWFLLEIPLSLSLREVSLETIMWSCGTNIFSSANEKNKIPYWGETPPQTLHICFQQVHYMISWMNFPSRLAMQCLLPDSCPYHFRSPASASLVCRFPKGVESRVPTR